MIKEHARTYDFELIMKLTQKEVALEEGEFEENCNTVTVKQSISLFANNLSKKVYLTQDNKSETIDNFLIDKSLKRYCLIFDNYDFDQTELTSRNGSHQEAKFYLETFKELGFETKIYPENGQKFNLTSNEIKSILNEAKIQPCSMFVTIFLSNGNEKFVTCPGEPLWISEIMVSILNKECENLIGIPKVVIFSPIYEGKYKKFMGYTTKFIDKYSLCNIDFIIKYFLIWIQNLILGIGIEDISSEEELSSTDEASNDKAETKFHKRIRIDGDTRSYLTCSNMDDKKILMPTFSETIVCYSTIEGNISLQNIS